MAASMNLVVEWIDAIASRGINLTTWEEQFIEDMQTKVERFGDRAMFTKAQADIVERIYTDRCP